MPRSMAARHRLDNEWLKKFHHHSFETWQSNHQRAWKVLSGPAASAAIDHMAIGSLEPTLVNLSQWRFAPTGNTVFPRA